MGVCVGGVRLGALCSQSNAQYVCVCMYIGTSCAISLQNLMNLWTCASFHVVHCMPHACAMHYHTVPHQV